MPEAKHPKPTSLIPLNDPVADIFARSADQWFATQAALLAGVDALTHAWLHRRRPSVDATRSRRSSKWPDARTPEKCFISTRNGFLACFSRVTEDIAAFNSSISSIANCGSPDKNL
jgi:hypothetical protein